MGTKKALIIASTKHHGGFDKILPRADDSAITEKFAEPLKRILSDPELAGFSEVTLLVDKKYDELIRCIGRFFSASSGDEDLLFFYFYGFGIADNDRTLYLLAGDSSPICYEDDSFASLERCLDISNVVIKQAAKCSKASKIVFLDVLWGTTISADDLKAGNAEEDKNRWIEMLDKVPRLSVILANEVFSNNYYALEHWSEIRRSRFSLIILQKLQEFLRNTDGNNRITIDELYGYVVTELKRDKADLKPWKWDPGDKLGPTELMRVNRTSAPLLTLVQNSNSDAGLKNGKFKQKKCFVISPLKGKRAEWVLKHVIDRGCLRAGYEAKRSDHLLTAEIMPTVIRELRESPMTVAYLGPTEGQWSPNVMIEVGFRLATNKPIVLLREEPLENEEPLPFDIKDRRTIYLPRQQAEVKQDLEKTIEDVAESIRFLEESGEKPSNWNSDHPIAKLSFKIGKGSGTFLESSPAADALFAKAGIEGGLCTVELGEFISSLQAAMHPAQGEAFFEEQDKLIGKMFGPFWKVAKDKMPVATVPIIFSGDANRKAYLPIIVEHSQEGEDILLRILYLDVSGKLSESLWAEERISVCNLRGYGSKTTVAAMTA